MGPRGMGAPASGALAVDPSAPVTSKSPAVLRARHVFPI